MRMKYLLDRVVAVVLLVLLAPVLVAIAVAIILYLPLPLPLRCTQFLPLEPIESLVEGVL